MMTNTRKAIGLLPFVLAGILLAVAILIGLGTVMVGDFELTDQYEPPLRHEQASD